MCVFCSVSTNTIGRKKRGDDERQRDEDKRTDYERKRDCELKQGDVKRKREEDENGSWKNRGG